MPYMSQWGAIHIQTMAALCERGSIDRLQLSVREHWKSVSASSPQVGKGLQASLSPVLWQQAAPLGLLPVPRADA